MSKKDYDGMQETFHLMSSPKNAKRLLDAIKADKASWENQEI